MAQTAVALAQLHALTEELDQSLAVAWLASGGQQPESRLESRHYLRAWRAVGRRGERERQVSAVLDIGNEMIHLTRAPGLRLMLKMMRRPAAAAGLASLQRFLEAGFDTFAELARGGHAREFLKIVGHRESELIAMFFDADADADACEMALKHILGQAP